MSIISRLYEGGFTLIMAGTPGNRDTAYPGLAKDFISIRLHTREGRCSKQRPFWCIFR